MRIVLTGATGFLGSNLLPGLRAAGHDVFPLGGTVAPEGGRRVDLGDLEALHAAFEGADAVVHAAGLGDPGADESLLGWLEVAGTENAARAARKAGVRRFVAFSSTDAHLAKARRDGATESHTVAVPATRFGRIQRAKEETLLGLGTPSFEPVLLRAGLLYGPGARVLVRRLVEESDRSGGPLHAVGQPFAPMPTTYVGNLVDAARLAVETKAAAHARYLVRDRELGAQLPLLERLAEALGLPGAKPFGVRALEPLWVRFGRGALEHDEWVRRAYGGGLIAKSAREELGYDAPHAGEDGMRELARWVAQAGGARAVAAASPRADASRIEGLRRAAG